MKPAARVRVALLLLITLTCVLALLRLGVDRPIDGGWALRWPQSDTIAAFRITAMFTGIIVGANLALSGLFLQGLLRNPLAEPFILGLSSGAGLGVMVALFLGEALKLDSLPASSQTVPAVLGAFGSLGVVFLLSSRRRMLDPVSLILVGTVVSTIAGAGIMYFQHLVPTGLRADFTTWLTGTIPEVIDRPLLLGTAGVTVCSMVAGLMFASSLDVAALGDDEARSVGLSLQRLRVTLFVLSGALAALSVALSGPIGFVGLVAPHLARLMLGPRHRPLVLACVFIGASIMLAADSLRQLMDFGAGRMPIGILTSILGGPIFIYLLVSGRGRP